MVDQKYVTKRYLGQEPLVVSNNTHLRHLDIELTERCNSKCMHCYINLPAGDKRAIDRELSTAQWKEILTQAAELGVLSVRLTGGEPLLRVDFVDIYLFARRLGLQVILFTNARLITPELADLFSRVPPLRKIEVSAYGMHAGSYDAVTGVVGAYSEFRRGLDLLRARDVPFVVKSVLLPPNRNEIEEFEAWAASIPYMDRFPTYSIFLDHRTRRDLPAKNRLIDKLRFSPEDGVMLANRYREAHRTGMLQFISKFMGIQGDKLFPCGAGESGCVDAYGKYQMCMLLRHPDTVYDLKTGTLRDAFTSFFPLQKELRATNPAYISRCARCFLKGLCEQCPGKSWSEHGTLDTPVEYLCQVAHAEARYLQLITENENAWEVENGLERIKKLKMNYQTELSQIVKKDSTL